MNRFAVGVLLRREVSFKPIHPYELCTHRQSVHNQDLCK